MNNGMPMIIRKNVGVEEIAGKGYLNYRSGISFNLTIRTENGLQSKKEEPIINKIEEDIFSRLNNNSTSIVAMVISSNNFKEYVVYHNNNVAFNETTHELQTKFTEYEFSTYTDNDKKWDVYSQF